MTQITLYTGGGVSFSPVYADGRTESDYVRLVADEGKMLKKGEVTLMCVDVSKADVSNWSEVPCVVPIPEPTAEEATPAWDITQGEYIPEGFLLTRDGVTYECIVGHYAAWNKQPPNSEYWKEV